MMVWQQLADRCFTFETFSVPLSADDIIWIFLLVLIYRNLGEVSCILKLLKLD